MGFTIAIDHIIAIFINTMYRYRDKMSCWKSHAAAGVTVTCHQNQNQNQKMKEQSGSNRHGHGHGSSSSSTAKRCISSGITRALVLLILLTAPSSTVSSEDSSTSTQSEIIPEDGVSPFRIVSD